MESHNIQANTASSRDLREAAGSTAERGERVAPGQAKQRDSIRVVQEVQRATLLLLLFSLSPFALAKPTLPDCCQQKNCPCRILELLHGMGNHAAGILTLGKRSGAGSTKAFQSRLYRLLHGSDNQAAGILTMGKRTSETASAHKEGVPSTQPTPAPVATGPNPAKGCLAPLDKDSTSRQKAGVAETIY